MSNVMDILKGDTFSMAALTGVVSDVDYNPQTLGEMKIFKEEAVNQQTVMIDRTADTLSLIGFTERGSAPVQNERYTRDSLYLSIPRIAIQDTVWAHELAGLREVGTSGELMAIQREVAKRLASMRQKVEYTEEKLRLGAIQGKVLDPADGSVYYNYFDEFGETEAAVVDFALTTDSTDVGGICRNLVRDVAKASKGGFIRGQSYVAAVVGDTFFDNLVAHPKVTEKWHNWSAAAELRNIDPYSEFRFGSITFMNYRGSDTSGDIEVGDNEAKFFIANGEGIFGKAMAPADEFAPFLNQQAKPIYAIQEIDAAFPSTPRFAKYHVHSLPLYYCAKPATLRSGVGNT